MSKLGFCDLPTDLGDQIISELDRAEMHTLRATCKPLLITVNTKCDFYSSFRLNASQDFAEGRAALLRAILENPAGWPQQAHTFHIEADKPHGWGSIDCFHRTYTDEEVFRETLAAFLNIRTFVFQVSRFRECVWLPGIVRKAFSSGKLAHIESLEVSFRDGYNMGPEQGYPISFRLTSARTPNLRTLKIDTNVAEVGLPVNEIASLVRQAAHLTVLHLHGHEDRTFAPIWKFLKQEKIALVDLATNALSPSLVTYLASFAGLRLLALTGVGTRTADTGHRRGGPEALSRTQMDDAAVKFFSEALPRHAATLEELTVLSHYQGPWNVRVRPVGNGPGWLKAQNASMRVLRRLCVQVNEDEVLDSDNWQAYFPEFVPRIRALLASLPSVTELEVRLVMLASRWGRWTSRREDDYAAVDKFVALAENPHASGRVWAVSVREWVENRREMKSLLFVKRAPRDED